MDKKLKSKIKNNKKHYATLTLRYEKKQIHQIKYQTLTKHQDEKCIQ